MKIASITVGKSRSLKLGKLRETWVKVEITATYAEEETPTEESLQDLLDEVEQTLKTEEVMERAHWNETESKLRKQ
jgi:hypothetical protein